jgi:hypothetical protein
MNLKRGILQILLAASLLAAQYAALAHGLVHAQQGLSAAALQEDGGGQRAPASLCDFHMVFAEVLGAVASGVSAPALCAGVDNPDDVFVWHSCIAQPADQRSRGPPAIL